MFCSAACCLAAVKVQYWGICHIQLFMICTSSKASKHEVYALIDNSTSLSPVTVNLESNSGILQNFGGLDIKRSMKTQSINQSINHSFPRALSWSLGSSSCLEPSWSATRCWMVGQDHCLFYCFYLYKLLKLWNRKKFSSLLAEESFQSALEQEFVQTAQAQSSVLPTAETRLSYPSHGGNRFFPPLRRHLKHCRSGQDLG